jgi:hypothetical protein
MLASMHWMVSQFLTCLQCLCSTYSCSGSYKPLSHQEFHTYHSPVALCFLSSYIIWNVDNFSEKFTLYSVCYAVWYIVFSVVCHKRVITIRILKCCLPYSHLLCICIGGDTCCEIFRCVTKFETVPLLTRVEAGSNTSTVTLRVVGGDEKGSLEYETVKYGHEFYGTRTRTWLRWRGPAAIVNDRPVLSSERVSQINKHATVRQ